MHFIPTFYVILRKPHEIFPFRTCVLESGQLLQSQCTSRKWKIFSTHRTASLCLFYPCPREKHHRASFLLAFSASLASFLLPFPLKSYCFFAKSPTRRLNPVLVEERHLWRSHSSRFSSFIVFLSVLVHGIE